MSCISNLAPSCSTGQHELEGAVDLVDQYCAL